MCSKILRVIPIEMNSLICSSGCPALEPKTDPTPAPELPPGLPHSVTILHHNITTIKIFITIEGSDTHYNFPYFISAFLGSSTNPLLLVVRAYTTFQIYPYFPQGLPRLHQVPYSYYCSQHYSHPRVIAIPLSAISYIRSPYYIPLTSSLIPLHITKSR